MTFPATACGFLGCQNSPGARPVYVVVAKPSWVFGGPEDWIEIAVPACEEHSAAAVSISRESND